MFELFREPARYRALTNDQLDQRRDALMAELGNAESEVSTSDLRAEVDLVNDEYDRRSMAANLRNQAAARVASGAGVHVADPATVAIAEPEDPTSTDEYRSAFKAYIQRGAKSDVLRSESVRQFAVENGYVTRAAASDGADLGVLVPTTVIQSIIKDAEKVYGQLYAKVLKTNLPGGVKYPIGSFGATFHRIAETAVSERQDFGGVTGSVDFGYKIGEVRLARTLLQQVLSVPAFEAEYAKVIAEAYVEAMDTEILTGDDAKNEMCGILTEANKTSGSRVLAANVIEFTAAEMADWTSWQTKLFAKVPLSMRGLRPEFVMTNATYEADIKTLKDKNDRPLYAETYNPVDGTETATFKARPVTFVENDGIKDFDDAANGEFFGLYWVPSKAYAINTNMAWRVQDYFDHETNQQVRKGIVINDGKVLDPKYLYLLKKKVGA